MVPSARCIWLAISGFVRPRPRWASISSSRSESGCARSRLFSWPGSAIRANSVNGGVYRSEDGGVTWTRQVCGFTTSRANSVLFDPNDANVGVVGLEGGEPSFGGLDGYYGGGIFRTVDGGANWDRIFVGPNDERNGYWEMKALHDEPSTFVTFGMNYYDGSENIGFIRSADAGATWEPFAPQLRDKRITAFSISASGSTIYANERDTYSAWVSRDAGATWGQSDIVQFNGASAVSPDDANTVVFSAQSKLRRTNDGLSTVSVVGSSATAFREIVFAPSDTNVVYAETDGYVLYRSDDAGRTWRFVVNVRDQVLNAGS